MQSILLTLTHSFWHRPAAAKRYSLAVGVLYVLVPMLLVGMLVLPILLPIILPLIGILLLISLLILG